MSSQLLIETVLPELATLYETKITNHDTDSGRDLYVGENGVIHPQETKFIKLAIKTKAVNSAGENVGYMIMPRSSMAKTPMRLSNSIGLVDAGYRGELLMCVDNIGKEDFEYHIGDRFVQAVFFDGKSFDCVVVPKLDDTARGTDGWGSTGVKSARSVESENAVPDVENKRQKTAEKNSPKIVTEEEKNLEAAVIAP